MGARQVVLITGSSSGFGRLTAETLARKGYRVFASMRGLAGRNSRPGSELRALADRESLDLRAVEMDVTDEASVESCIGTVLDQAGRIDVVVNNAGFGNWGLTEAYTVEQFRLLFETNFFGVVRVNRAVLPALRRQGSGLLIHVTSGAGRVAVPFMAPYCASKFALEALADAYRFELAPLGIDSVIVEPGEYRTPIFDKNMEPADRERAEGYGSVGALPRKLFDAFVANMSGPNAQNPQEVADTILRLIETPPGKRPLRTLVGQDVQPLQPLNATSEEIRRAVIGELFRMPELLELRASSRAKA